MRSLAYQYGGFWVGLLGNWRPNYQSQPVLMFATYAFLHGGFWHFLVNMVTLFALGDIVVERVGQWRFGVLYGLSILGGAIGFALFSNAPQPMVGASGALFGLTGALAAWEYLDRTAEKEDLYPVFKLLGFLLFMNLILWWAMNGQLAWETHLGGFVAGWLFAMVVNPPTELSESA